MDLDSLAQSISAVSEDPAVRRLSNLLLDWKSDETTVEQLRERVERYIGNSWIESRRDHETVYQLWSTFRDQAILGIGGMTMNERLWWFGLFSLFDECETDYDREHFYKKLLASP